MTKIHPTVDALGNPTGFHLTPGQAHNPECADVLLKGRVFVLAMPMQHGIPTHWRMRVRALKLWSMSTILADRSGE